MDTAWGSKTALSALLRVNKQVYDEAIDVFYVTNTFQITNEEFRYLPITHPLFKYVGSLYIVGALTRIGRQSGKSSCLYFPRYAGEERANNRKGFREKLLLMLQRPTFYQLSLTMNKHQSQAKLTAWLDDQQLSPLRHIELGVMRLEGAFSKIVITNRVVWALFKKLMAVSVNGQSMVMDLYDRDQGWAAAGTIWLIHSAMEAFGEDHESLRVVPDLRQYIPQLSPIGAEMPWEDTVLTYEAALWELYDACTALMIFVPDFKCRRV